MQRHSKEVYTSYWILGRYIVRHSERDDQSFPLGRSGQIAHRIGIGRARACKTPKAQLFFLCKYEKSIRSANFELNR